MATYSLAGSGTQALAAGTGALRVHVTTVPSLAGNGRANPLNLYDVGLLRQGDATDWWRAESIDAVHMLLPLLQGTTQIGYALLNGATIDVTEVIGTSPFYPPSSGGGSITVAHATLTAPVTLAASTIVDVLAAALGAGTWIVFAHLSVQASAASHGIVRIFDGTTEYGSANFVVPGASWIASAAIVTEPFVLAGSATLTLQARWNVGATALDVNADPASPAWHKATQLTALQVA